MHRPSNLHQVRNATGSSLSEVLLACTVPLWMVISSPAMTLSRGSLDTPPDGNTYRRGSRMFAKGLLTESLLRSFGSKKRSLILSAAFFEGTIEPFGCWRTQPSLKARIVHRR